MGPHRSVVNLDKHEYIDPRQLGDGIRLVEFGLTFGGGGTMTALAILLGTESADGSGDLPRDPLVGSWAGDHIAIVGDQGDALTRFGAPGLYGQMLNGEEGWREISPQLRPLIERWQNRYRFEFDGSDWHRVGTKP